MIAETAMLLVGVWLYARATHPRDKIGRHALWAFVAMLLFLYIGGSFGGPPESMRETAWTGLIATGVSPWAARFDAHRDAVV